MYHVYHYLVYIIICYLFSLGKGFINKFKIIELSVVNKAVLTNGKRLIILEEMK